MADLTQLLQQLGAKASYFAPNSRYKNIGTKTMTGADGAGVLYLQRRILPPADSFVLLQEHIVNDGDRLDTITNQYLGDPEKFWQLCDANNTLHPDELTANPGDRIRITLPEGIPG